MSVERLNFRVESPENFVKIACTVLFGKREGLSDYATVWHDVFDGSAGDQRFRQFMEELFPDGCTIGKKELHQLTDRAIHYLKTETICLDIKAGHDMAQAVFWVYFIPEHKVYECDYGSHEEKVIEILTNFFGTDIMKYPVSVLKKFILGSFRIKSTQTTVGSIAADAEFIQMAVYGRSKPRGSVS